jgi:hypothetical protein
MAGTTRGLRVAVSGTSQSYVSDLSPSAETGYHARFYFHPNNTATGGAAFDVFQTLNASNGAVLRIQYRRTSAGALQVRAGALTRGGSTSYTAWSTISNAAHALEVGWQATASSTLSLWVDGSLAVSLAGLDTSTARIEAARVGASAGLTSAASGTLYFDSFVSTRGAYVGP